MLVASILMSLLLGPSPMRRVRSYAIDQLTAKGWDLVDAQSRISQFVWLRERGFRTQEAKSAAGLPSKAVHGSLADMARFTMFDAPSMLDGLRTQADSTDDFVDRYGINPHAVQAAMEKPDASNLDIRLKVMRDVRLRFAVHCHLHYSS